MSNLHRQKKNIVAKLCRAMGLEDPDLNLNFFGGGGGADPLQIRLTTQITKQ